eukprot:59800-Prorocentrum_lima.AAC.1
MERREEGMAAHQQQIQPPPSQHQPLSTRGQAMSPSPTRGGIYKEHEEGEVLVLTEEMMLTP